VGLITGMKSRIVSPPALLAGVLGCASLIPPLLGRGGFIDSLLYASIARNLSLADWGAVDLSFSDTLYHEFAEQPPLMFWLGSVWFRLLGDHAWTEKSFSLLIALLLVGCFHRFWRNLWAGTDNARGWGWWMLFMCLIPGPLWGFSQFMLENPLTLLTFLGVWSAMGKGNLTAGAGLGLCTFLAFLTKGPPALFPLAAPVLLALCHLRKPRPMLIVTALSLSVFALLSAAGWLWQPLRAAMQGYWERQVHATFAGTRSAYEPGVERTRLELLWTFAQEMLLPIVVLAIVYITHRVLLRRNAPPESSTLHTAGMSTPGFVTPKLNHVEKKQALFFLLVAFSATAPLFVSPKLHPHYLIPSYPWWTLALTAVSLAFLRIQPLGSWGPLSRRQGLYLNVGIVLFLLICVSLAWGNRNKPVRDVGLQRDLEEIVQVVRRSKPLCPCEGIGISRALHGQYSIWLYMQRYHKLSLYPNPTTRQCAVIVTKGSAPPLGFSSLPSIQSDFSVWICTARPQLNQGDR